MNIRVDLQEPIYDGKEVLFRSPVDCSQITGLILYYPENGIITSREFAFTDAHGHDVGDIDHLFSEDVVVKVILDLVASKAFVQNADTNAYLEGRFTELEAAIGSGGGGGTAGAVLYTPQSLTDSQMSQAQMNIGAVSLNLFNGFANSMSEQVSANTAAIGDIDAALDELHAYAQNLIAGGDA